MFKVSQSPVKGVWLSTVGLRNYQVVNRKITRVLKRESQGSEWRRNLNEKTNKPVESNQKHFLTFALYFSGFPSCYLGEKGLPNVSGVCPTYLNTDKVS